MLIACWITKATDTHSEYVVLLAFARELWLHERASFYVYVSVACLLYFVPLRQLQLVTDHLHS
jgi:hypothetical protein